MCIMCETWFPADGELVSRTSRLSVLLFDARPLKRKRGNKKEVGIKHCGCGKLARRNEFEGKLCAKRDFGCGST